MISCATPRSNTSAHREYSVANLQFLRSPGETELLVDVAVYVGKEVLEWESEKYVQISRAKRDGVSDDRKYRPEVPQLFRNEELFFSFVRLTEKKSEEECWYHRIRKCRPDNLEPFDEKMVRELVDSTSSDIKPLVKNVSDRLRPLSVLKLFRVELPTSEALTDSIQRKLLRAQRNHEITGSMSREEIAESLKPLLANRTVKDDCENKAGASTDCVEQTKKDLQVARSHVNSVADTFRNALCKGEPGCDPVSEASLHKLLLAGPIVGLCEGSGDCPKRYLSLVLLGRLEPLPKARDLFRPRLIAYRYSSLKAKNLSWNILDYDETETVVLVEVRGPKSQEAEDGGGAVSKFQIDWDREGAKANRDSVWVPWLPSKNDSGGPVPAFAFPDTRDLSIAISVSEASDFSEALKDLAELLEKIK
jgi:hypothetical protein